MPTHQLLACFERYDRTSRHICNYATGSLTPTEGPDTLLNQILLSNSTTGKYAPMQAVKQPVRGKALNIEEQNCLSSRRTVIYATP